MKNKRLDWKDIRKEFKILATIDRTKIQLKNHYDILSKKLKAYEALMEETCIGINQYTKLLAITYEAWEAFKKVSLLKFIIDDIVL